jgi:hypothetical protein
VSCRLQRKPTLSTAQRNHAGALRSAFGKCTPLYRWQYQAWVYIFKPGRFLCPLFPFKLRVEAIASRLVCVDWTVIVHYDTSQYSVPSLRFLCPRGATGALLVWREALELVCV